MYSVLGE